MHTRTSIPMQRFLRIVDGAPRAPEDAREAHELGIIERRILADTRLTSNHVQRLAAVTGLNPYLIRKRQTVFASRLSTPELSEAVERGVIDLDDAYQIVREADRRHFRRWEAQQWINEQAMTLLMTDLREAKLGISIY